MYIIISIRFLQWFSMEDKAWDLVVIPLKGDLKGAMEVSVALINYVAPLTSSYIFRLAPIHNSKKWEKKLAYDN